MCYLWMISLVIHGYFLCNLNMKSLIFLSNLSCMLKTFSHPQLSARLFPRFALKKGFLKKARPKIAFG